MVIDNESFQDIAQQSIFDNGMYIGTIYFAG